MYLLLLSTLSCVLDAFGSSLIKYATIYASAHRKYDTDLKNCLISLRQEMSGLSMMDEFSKYAKLQRKCSNLEQTLKKNARERLSARLKLQAIASISFRLLNGILLAVLLCFHRSEAVVTLPEGALWPLRGMLSWPSANGESVSLVVWLLVTRSVVAGWKQTAPV